MAEMVRMMAEFLVFCEEKLTGPSLGLLDLIRKRYDRCALHFKNSSEMSHLIKSTHRKMETDERHMFVHLKDFLNELKAYSVTSEASSLKRKTEKTLETAPKKVKLMDNHFRVGTPQGNNTWIDDTPSCSPMDVPEQEHSTTTNYEEVQGKKIDHLQTINEISPDVVEISDSQNSCTYFAYTSTDSKNSCSSLKNSHTHLENSCTDSNKSCIDSKNPHVLLAAKKKIKSTLDQVINNLSSVQNGSGRPHNSQTSAHQNSFLKFLDLKKNEDSADDSDSLMIVEINSTGKSADVTTSDVDQHMPKNDSAAIAENTPGTSHLEVELPCEPSVSSLETVSEDLKPVKKSISERRIRKLERLLERLRDEIEKIRKQEVSLDDLDAEDSAYIYEDKLQKKFVAVWKKLCQLKERAPTTGRPTERRFTYEGTRYPEINRKIEKLVNKKKIFPDFHDVRKVIQKVNTDKHLRLGSGTVDDIAREAFTDVGNLLQERRHEDFVSTFGCSLTDAFRFGEDPAMFDAELRSKLDDNRRKAKSNLAEVINKYTKMQYEVGEKPEEVGDSEAEKSPNDDEEEEEETVPSPNIDELNSDSDDEKKISELPSVDSEDPNSLDTTEVPDTVDPRTPEHPSGGTLEICESQPASKMQASNEPETLTISSSPEVLSPSSSHSLLDAWLSRDKTPKNEGTEKKSKLSLFKIKTEQSSLHSPSAGNQKTLDAFTSKLGNDPETTKRLNGGDKKLRRKLQLYRPNLISVKKEVDCEQNVKNYSDHNSPLKIAVRQSSMCYIEVDEPDQEPESSQYSVEVNEVSSSNIPSPEPVIIILSDSD